jgi:hypothetical protein
VLLPQDPNRNPGTKKILRAVLWCAVAAAAYGQNTGAPAAVSGGQGEIAAQGYYMGGNQQDFLNTTGLSLRFQEFVPDVGLLTGSLEGYGSQNRFQPGENLLELRGLPWAGHYWTFTGGDFRMPAGLVEFPFNNIYTPEIEGRGVKVQAVHGDTQYSFFWGQEMLTAGPRVAYRIPAPQTVMGASTVHKVAPHLLVGARFMQFSASQQSIADNPYLFPPGRTAGLVRTMAVQSLYNPVKRLKIYAEVSRPTAAGEHELTSVLTGLTWEGPVFTLKANYVYQGTLYFPLAGYFAGDRRGPFGEAHFRPWKRLDLYASASQYRNNLERDATLPTLTSNNVSAGLSALLPGKLSFTGQLSTVRFSDQAPGQDNITSNNRQTSAALSRSIGRQTLQLNWREIRLDMAPSPQRQRSTELGDTYQFKHFSLGGAMRYQQVTGSQRLNSLFFRGLAQVNLGRVSAYANIEVGNDLANQTVFSTEAYRTSVVGASVRLPGRWNLQTEVFRNQLNLTLNEENVFLLQNGETLAGISPAAASLSNFNQWSVFFRLSKPIRWGGGLPSENAVGVIGGAVVRLTGNIEGIVRLKTLAAATLNAASVPVSLDNGRTAVSGPDGHYFFTNVPEGVHEVGLAMDELPADFDPGESPRNQIVVQPNRVARADFEVLPLTSISGRVTGPEKLPLEDIIIRLLPGSRYTSTDRDGAFAFYNVREGDFDLLIDPATLPEGAALESPASVRTSARIGTPASPVEFIFVTIKSAPKPVRKVLLRD